MPILALVLLLQPVESATVFVDLFEEPVNETNAERFCPRGVGAAVEWPHVFHHLRGNQHGKWPMAYKVAIPTISFCLLLISLMLLPHVQVLMDEARKEESQRGQRIVLIASVPLAIVALKFVAVLAPRTWKLLFLVVAIYEVLAFRSFKNVILELVSADNGGKKPVEVMAAAEPVALWAVPPLACCFKPCASKKSFTDFDLWVIETLLVQFMIIKPLVALAEMSEYMTHELEEKVGRFEVLSLLFAMYGLFALLEASHSVLHERRLGHAKFWVIKGVFIASTATFRICCNIFRQDLRAGDFCYTSETLASAWSGAATAVFCVPLAILARYAFPTTDLFALPMEKERHPLLSAQSRSIYGD